MCTEAKAAGLISQPRLWLAGCAGGCWLWLLLLSSRPILLTIDQRLFEQLALALTLLAAFDCFGSPQFVVQSLRLHTVINYP